LKQLTLSGRFLPLNLFLRFGLGFCVLCSFRSLDACVLELLEEKVWVIVRAVIILFFFLLSLEHSLDEAWALNGVVVLLGVFVQHTVRVILLDINLNAHLLVEADVAVVADVAVEGELASTTEFLLHLELHLVGAFLAPQSLNLDDILLGLRVDDDDVPVGTADEWVILRVDVTWAMICGQIVVCDRNGECDNIAGSDSFFTFNVHLICHSDDWHASPDDFFELGELGLIASEETKFGALRRR